MQGHRSSPEVSDLLLDCRGCSTTGRPMVWATGPEQGTGCRRESTPERGRSRGGTPLFGGPTCWDEEMGSLGGQTRKCPRPGRGTSRERSPRRGTSVVRQDSNAGLVIPRARANVRKGEASTRHSCARVEPAEPSPPRGETHHKDEVDVYHRWNPEPGGTGSRRKGWVRYHAPSAGTPGAKAWATAPHLASGESLER